MQVIGGQSQPALATEELEGKVNYLLGNDPAAWRTDIPTFGRVTYQDIYPGYRPGLSTANRVGWSTTSS